MLRPPLPPPVDRSGRRRWSHKGRQGQWGRSRREGWCDTSRRVSARVWHVLTVLCEDMLSFWHTTRNGVFTGGIQNKLGFSSISKKPKFYKESQIYKLLESPPALPITFFKPIAFELVRVKPVTSHYITSSHHTTSEGIQVGHFFSSFGICTRIQTLQEEKHCL